jgi:hypothetical protein
VLANPQPRMHTGATSRGGAGISKSPPSREPIRKAKLSVKWLKIGMEQPKQISCHPTIVGR